MNLALYSYIFISTLRLSFLFDREEKLEMPYIKNNKIINPVKEKIFYFVTVENQSMTDQQLLAVEVIKRVPELLLNFCVKLDTVKFRQNYKVNRNQYLNSDFQICTLHIDIIKVFYLPTDAQ